MSTKVTEQFDEEATLWRLVWNEPPSNLWREITYPSWRVSYFSSVPPDTCGDSNTSQLQPIFQETNFPSHHSPAILL